MTEYVQGDVRKIADSLAKEGVPSETAERILEGGADLAKDAPRPVRAEWLAGAMRRMDELLDPAVAHAARERCACCLGGKRLKLSRAIAQEHESLEDRIRAANETPFVFGYGVALTEEGAVRVSFFPEGRPQNPCPCLGKVDVEMPLTYCYCCGGHVKHHLQNALGRKVEITVEASVLASGGKEGCRFLARLV